MTTLDQHARLVREWIELQDPDRLPALMADMADDHPILRAVDAIADAADSRDEERAAAGNATFFGSLIEPWNDQLTASLRAVSTRIVAHVIWRCAGRDTLMHAALAEHGLNSERALLERYQRLRAAHHRAPALAERIMVLSRVTIGADILLTSVLLQHIRQAWSSAEILLVGDPKIGGLLGGLSGMRVIPLHYARRGRLSHRLRAWLAVHEVVAQENPDVLINPDSRLDQLGLLPLMEEARTFHWQNTLPSGEPASLAELIADWCNRRFPAAATISIRPRLFLPDITRMEKHRLRRALGTMPTAAVKLDHGGNPAKALPRSWEVDLLHDLRAKGWRILIDRGFDADEYAHSDRLLTEADLHPFDISDCDPEMGLAIASLDEGRLASEPVIRFHGSIAGWAACLGCCRLAISYDSVGQHLAAASGIPVVVPFAGYSNPDFPIAWQPQGHAPVHIHRFPDEASKQDPARLTAILDDIPTVESSA